MVRECTGGTYSVDALYNAELLPGCQRVDPEAVFVPIVTLWVHWDLMQAFLSMSAKVITIQIVVLTRRVCSHTAQSWRLLNAFDAFTLALVSSGRDCIKSASRQRPCQHNHSRTLPDGLAGRKQGAVIVLQPSTLR